MVDDIIMCMYLTWELIHSMAEERSMENVTFYNVCPAGIESGGPELAHQMCNTLGKLGYRAQMYYIESDVVEPIDVPASSKYIKYGTEHVKSIKEVEDSPSVVVFNEGATGWIPVINNCHKVLWWMSVDNYIINTQEKDMHVLREQIELHLVQSAYAYHYVTEHIGISKDKVMYVSDYIGDIYMANLPEMPRQNIVLYNPKKGFDRLKPIIENTRWVKWIPLIGLSEEDMTAYMHISKIYIDFGNHPGKDRIPREAARCGCCIITNKRGSAAYYEDVPVPDKYKFEDETDIEAIQYSIRTICDNFYESQQDFEGYRRMISGEKKAFYNDVKEFAKHF